MQFNNGRRKKKFKRKRISNKKFTMQRKEKSELLFNLKKLVSYMKIPGVKLIIKM